MAEAVAALGFASSILAFIDFGLKLSSRFYEFYKTSRDNHEAVPDVDSLTKDLRGVLQDLGFHGAGQDPDATGFDRIAKDCDDVAAELLRILSSLQRSHNSSTRASALKAAFKLVWTEDDVMRLQQRLDRFRAQLLLHLVSNLRTQIRQSELQQARISKEISSVLDKTQEMHGYMQQRIGDQTDLGNRVVALLISKLDTEDKSRQEKSLRGDLITGLLESGRKPDDGAKSTPMIPKAQEDSMYRRFLARLSFSEMRAREESVADAHAKTFEWVFENGIKSDHSWANLGEWLRSKSKLYWITGKAGSGKSTLMKFICHDEAVLSATEHKTIRSEPRCQHYLRSWAPKPLKLLVARYFFWNSGTALQMSYEGLLRSLLAQILGQAPSLVPFVSPGWWEALYLFGDDRTAAWTENELAQMLRSAVLHLEQDMRLCLFIDGLDEFNGDHSIVTRLLQTLSNMPRVKMCVASRPWDVFETAFHQNPSLRMEDLTYEDIKVYTSSELCEDVQFAVLREREPEYSVTLVENVVAKANGVFLWVRLVVASLLGGIGHGDRVGDLQRRLDHLPPELEKLYDKMLMNLDAFYLEHAAHLFTLVDTTLDPLSLAVLMFIDESDYDTTMKQRVEPLHAQILHSRLEAMRRRINSRTKGLLELTKTINPCGFYNDLGGVEFIVSENLGVHDELGERTIQYLHRTVRDYLKQDQAQECLRRALRTPFDVHMSLCIGILSLIKTMKPTEQLFRSTTFWNLITQFMYSASRTKPESAPRLILIMDELDTTAAVLAKSAVVNESKTRTKYHDTGLWVGLHPVVRNPHHFHSFAVQYGVVDYISAKTINGCFIQVFTNPLDYSGPKSTATNMHTLLADACAYHPGYGDDWHIRVPSVKMVSCLLANGAWYNPDLETWLTESDPALALLESSTHLDMMYRRSTVAGAWTKIIHLITENHDQIWPPEVMANIDTKSRHHYINALRSYPEAVRIWPKPDAPPSLLSRIGLQPSISTDKIKEERLYALKRSFRGELDSEFTGNPF